MNFKYNRTPKVNQLMRLEVKDFKGVDYSNTPLNVAPFRAIDMQNFIYEKGINQTRRGWNEIFKGYGRINGYWSLKINNEIHHIIHVGNDLYRIYFGNNSFETTTTLITPQSSGQYIRLSNDKSFGIVKGDRLYIFCGAYIVYDGNKCSIIDSDTAYIPTTTIGITPINSEIEARTSLEKVNMLSRRRRNKLIGNKLERNYISLDVNDIAPSPAYGSYPQKTYVNNIYESITGLYISIMNEDAMVQGTIPIVRDGNNYYYDMQKMITGNIFYNGKTGQDINDFLNGISLYCNYNEENGLVVSITFDRLNDATVISCNLLQDNEKEATYQLDAKNIAIPGYELGIPISHIYVTINGVKYTEDSVNDNSNIFEIDYDLGRITFFDYHPPEIDGESNIIVDFEVKSTPESIENYEKISKCRFGIMFGYNDMESLFISGNPKYPNMDWHSGFKDESESDNNIPANEDLTYFPDTSYTVFGNKESKVMGYSLLGDGSLAIHKSKNGSDPTLYIRTAIITDAIDSLGNVVYDQNGQPFKEVSYPIKASMTGEAVISENAFANLAGDSLMLGENGVYSVIISNNVNANLRYARERSRLINDRLMRLPNIENAAAIAFKNKYYISVNNECYIADARFKTQYEGEMSDTFSYEWWRWTNIPARIWFTINDKLAFGTENGQICIFEDNTHIDREYITIGTGGILFDQQNNVFTINQLYDEVIAKLKDNDTIRLENNDNDYYLLEEQINHNEIISVESGTITVNDTCFNNVVRHLENKEVMIASTHGDNVYIIKNLDYENYSFELHKGGLKQTYISSGQIPYLDICTLAYGKEYKLTNMNYEEGTFQLANSDGELRRMYWLEYMPGSSLVGYFSVYHNVETYWQTPIFNLGTAEYSKNMHSITIVPEVIEGGKIDFGFKTRDLDRAFNVEGVTIFDFNNIDFSNFTFETSKFAKSFTKKIKVKNFNFITFYFKSNNGKNCAVNSISITYNINKLNKGVK